MFNYSYFWAIVCERGPNFVFLLVVCMWLTLLCIWWLSFWSRRRGKLLFFAMDCIVFHSFPFLSDSRGRECIRVMWHLNAAIFCSMGWSESKLIVVSVQVCFLPRICVHLTLFVFTCYCQVYKVNWSMLFICRVKFDVAVYIVYVCVDGVWTDSCRVIRIWLKFRLRISCKMLGFLCLVVVLSDGFGGLGVACLPLVLKFAGSNPAEAVGFLMAKKFSARLPSEGK